MDRAIIVLLSPYIYAFHSQALAPVVAGDFSEGDRRDHARVAKRSGPGSPIRWMSHGVATTICKMTAGGLVAAGEK